MLDFLLEALRAWLALAMTYLVAFVTAEAVLRFLAWCFGLPRQTAAVVKAP